MKITLQGRLVYQTKDAAEYLGRSIYTVQKWCRQGRLAGAKKLGRDFVIPADSVETMKNALNKRLLRERIPA